MGVYGRSITKDKIISFTEFIEYFQESNYQMRMMFEKQELVYAIQEANDSDIQLPSIDKNIEVISGEPEKLKKTLIEWIKETFDKFIKAIKQLFEKLHKIIHDFYMKTNFIDDIVSKFKDKVTYQNITKAKENGWKGLSIEKNEALINREVDTYVSTLFQDKQSDDYIKEEEIISIIKADNLEKAREKYSIFEEKLKKFKDDGKKFENKSMYNMRIDNTSGLLGNIDIYTGFFGNYTDKEQKYYFPAMQQFNLTKEFAESGQSKIKKIRENYNYLTKELSNRKYFFLDNMKTFKKKGVNETEDKETNQINILYLKAQYEFSAAYISRVKRIISAIVSMLKDQHRIAIKSYTVMAMAVKKYATV